MSTSTQHIYTDDTRGHTGDRRLSTETRASFRTTELIAHVGPMSGAVLRPRGVLSALLIDNALVRSA